MRRQRADLLWRYAFGVNQTRHFDTGIFRQIVDKPVIGDIGVNFILLVQHKRGNYTGGIFNRFFACQCATAGQCFGLRLPFGHLRQTPARIFVQWNLELLYQVGSVGLDEIGRIFGKML